MFNRVYSNTIPFLGFSMDKDRTPFTILGVPLDMSTSFRGGSSMAPSRIRMVSKSLELCSLLTGIDIESIGFEDLGDMVLPPGDMLSSLRMIEEGVRRLLDKNRVLFIIGGEHTLTLASFKSLSVQSMAPCLLVFDAHTDLRDTYLGSRYNHATVLSRILEETNGNIILIGARAISREEIETYNKFRDRIEIVKLWQGNIRPSLGEEIYIKLKKCSDVYISIDFDILDPAYAPGVQTPEPLGIDPTTLLNILDLIIDDNVRVIDIVEITPQFDLSDVTSFLAAKVIVEVAAIAYRGMHKDVKNYSCWEIR